MSPPPMPQADSPGGPAPSSAGAAATSAAQPALRMRPIRFEEVPEVLRLVRRSIEVACRGHYDGVQREAVFAGYARTLFVESLGPFETVVTDLPVADSGARAGAVAGRVVAVAQLDPSEGRLRALFVDAELQGQGFGRALLAEVEERARRHGLGRLYGAMSLNAVSFYLRAGFRPYDGPGQLASAPGVIPILRMEKNIA